MYKGRFCTNSLTVSVNSSGKVRLILDLMHFNKFIHKFKGKIVDFNEALKFCQPGHVIFKILSA
jgi:DNA-dependent RNA polymerase auxiliary subunit epsilon